MRTDQGIIARADLHPRLATESGSIYQTDADLRTFLGYILEIRDESTAHRLLDLIQVDLDAIARHFATGGGDNAQPPHFWLRDQVLVAFGADDVQAARELATGIEAVPSEMGHRTGLLVLLKPTNRSVPEVLWLTSRAPGADVRIARLVDRLYDRGGELSVSRRESHEELTVLDLAARHGLFDVWERMHRMFGRHVLTPLQYANQIRQLVSFRPADQRVHDFDEMCRKYDDQFDVRSLCGTPDEAELLKGALSEDFVMYTHLQNISAEQRMMQENCSREEAFAQVINQTFDGRSIIHVAMKNKDPDVALKCLEFGPNNLHVRPYGDPAITELLSTLAPGAQVQQALLEQLDRIDAGMQFRWELPSLLIRYNWLDALKAIHGRKPSVLLGLGDMPSCPLYDCVVSGHFDMVQYVLGELGASRVLRLELLQEFVSAHAVDSCPDSLWNVLWSDDLCADAGFADVLCGLLRHRRVDNFGQLRRMCGDRLDVKAIVDSGGENLLFASLFNRDYVKQPPLRPCAESIPPSDEQLSSLNAQLEPQLDAVFAELLAAGVDIHCVNRCGQNLVHIAAKHSNGKLLLQLIALGVSAQLADNAGNRPMHYALSVEICDALPADDVHALNNDQQTPLLYNLCTTTYKQNESLIWRYLQLCADVKHLAPCGNSLHLVHDSVALVRHLLDAGVDVNARTSNGETPVQIAFARYRSTAIKRLLLEQPTVDILGTYSDGTECLLSELVCCGDDEMQELLPVLQMNTLPAQLDQLFTRHAQLLCNHHRLRNHFCRRRLLETAELDVMDEEFPDSKFFDEQPRWLIELGAHVRVRARKQPALDWTLCGDEDDEAAQLRQLRMFTEWGLCTEVRNSDGSTALQLLSDCACKQDVRVLALLLIAGANYRVTYCMKPRYALDDTVFRCVYEWDEESEESTEA